MTEPISQERIIRSYSDQVRQLSQQIAALKFARVTFGVHTLSLIVDGLEQVEAQAAAGDAEAKQLLTRLDACVKRIPALLAGIVLPAQPNGG